MRLPHRKWRTMSLFVARCQAARDSIFEDTRRISNIRESDEHTTGQPVARSRRETSPKNLPRFSALCRLILPPPSPPPFPSSSSPPRAPAELRSSFVRPRSLSLRFLFLSLSRRTYSLHPGRCTRGARCISSLCGVPWHSVLGIILRFKKKKKKMRNKIILSTRNFQCKCRIMWDRLEYSFKIFQD